MSECYYDAAGCLVCPEQPAAPAVPARVLTQAVLGWTAGGNSIDLWHGDLHTVFDMPMHVVGVVIGLKSGRANPLLPSLIEHGWYFHQVGGLDLCQPIERGKVIGTPYTGRTSNTQFEIRRVGRTVFYLRDGALVARSTTPSDGAKVINTCLYASSDSVPIGAVASTGGNGPQPPPPSPWPHTLTSGVSDTVSGLPQSAFPGDSDYDPTGYWTIQVPAGASNLAVVLSGTSDALAAADAIDPYIIALTGPSAVPPTQDDWNTAQGPDQQYLSGPTDPPPGGTPWRLDIANPAAGTWYIASDSTVNATLTLTATVS